ncbi:MAG TPA: hypothetical protein VND83_07910 [Acidimicrobiales bacterium]|nr:hypothetical protein [Acidimicrobiales bacterium]
MSSRRSDRRGADTETSVAHDDPSRRSHARLVWKLVALAVAVASTIIGRHKGYGFGGRTFVRCRRGHLFTTIWIPGASVKAVRLGWWRFQFCPVGRHWSLVVPVKETDLSGEERESANANRDRSFP